MRKTNKMWTKIAHLIERFITIFGSCRNSFRRFLRCNVGYRSRMPKTTRLCFPCSRHAVTFHAFQVLLWKSAELKPCSMWIDFISPLNWIFCLNNGWCGKQWWYPQRNEDFSAILGRCVGIMWVLFSDHFWSFQLCFQSKNQNSLFSLEFSLEFLLFPAFYNLMIWILG